MCARVCVCSSKLCVQRTARVYANSRCNVAWKFCVAQTKQEADEEEEEENYDSGDDEIRLFWKLTLHEK